MPERLTFTRYTEKPLATSAPRSLDPDRSATPRKKAPYFVRARPRPEPRLRLAADSLPHPACLLASAAVTEQPHGHHRPFGEDRFGRVSEKVARFFGTPQYIIGQSILVVAWIAVNSVAVVRHWDPYPFILLNLAFSTQAAYAAPLILLAQTRQADRDKLIAEETDKRHTRLEESANARSTAIKAETDKLTQLLQANTRLTEQDKELTEQVAGLTRQIHELLTKNQPQ